MAPVSQAPEPILASFVPRANKTFVASWVVELPPNLPEKLLTQKSVGHDNSLYRSNLHSNGLTISHRSKTHGAARKEVD